MNFANDENIVMEFYFRGVFCLLFLFSIVPFIKYTKLKKQDTVNNLTLKSNEDKNIICPLPPTSKQVPKIEPLFREYGSR